MCSGCSHQPTAVKWKQHRALIMALTPALENRAWFLPCWLCYLRQLPCASAPGVYPEEITLSCLQGSRVERYNKARRMPGRRGLSGSPGTALAGKKLRVLNHVTAAQWGSQSYSSNLPGLEGHSAHTGVRISPGILLGAAAASSPKTTPAWAALSPLKTGMLK